MRVLNVGGGPTRELPPHYAGWEQVLLDADPAVAPDVVGDARELQQLSRRSEPFDAVYCSHTLEHFHRHEVPAVLGGFACMLGPDGFAQIAVPDVLTLMECVVKGNQDVEDVWYHCAGGTTPITYLDVLYGWGEQIKRGNLLYCHKTAFTEKSLAKALKSAGFAKVLTARDSGNLHAFAFKATEPAAELLVKLGI